MSLPLKYQTRCVARNRQVVDGTAKPAAGKFVCKFHGGLIQLIALGRSPLTVGDGFPKHKVGSSLAI